MSSINDLIQRVATGQLADATTSAHDLLGQRVLLALDARKQEIASTLFQSTPHKSEGA